MAPDLPCFSATFSRRAVLAGASALALTPRAQAEGRPVFRIGTLSFGSVDWAVKTMTDHGFDTAAGIKVENVSLASNEAAKIAFLGGAVDTIGQDLLFAARLKAEGQPIVFLPYSSTEGALMVAAGSPIKTIADLAGKSIGVAGGPIDKNWLMLRAATLKAEGLDLAKDARPVYGAPPLLAAKVESGELDSGLLYWGACARLKGQGFRQVVSVEELIDSLGARGKIALNGFLFRQDAKPDVLAGFGKAMRQAYALLVDDPKAWAPVRPLMQAPDDATFVALKEAFARGIRHKPRADEIADAQAFYAIVAKLGGPQLVGSATSLPADLYVDQAVYG